MRLKYALVEVYIPVGITIAYIAVYTLLGLSLLHGHKRGYINLDGSYLAHKECIYCNAIYPIKIESLIENPFIELDKHKDYTQVVIDNWTTTILVEDYI